MKIPGFPWSDPGQGQHLMGAWGSSEDGVRLHGPKFANVISTSHLIAHFSKPKEPTASAKDAALLGARDLLEQLPRAKVTGQAQHTRLSIKPTHNLLLLTL